MVLTETFLTKEWYPKKSYAMHVLAEQGPRGRPKGGITCILSTKMSPFQVTYRSKNIICVKTAICTVIGTYFQPEFSGDEVIKEIAAILTTQKQISR